MAGRRFIHKGPQTPGTNTAASFVNKIAVPVLNNCLNTGILPSVVIGCALKESRNGNDYKAFVYNNLFGHMANSNWEGDAVKISTNPAKPYWRVYPSVDAAIKAHIKNLQGGKYKLQGVALKKTPLAQLQAMQRAGYNVGPDKHEYAAEINHIISDRGLEKYDRQLMANERALNENGLAFIEQDGITKVLHSILA